MLEHFRAAWAKVMNPIADALLRAHVTPDMVTWVGTVGAVAMALICFPQGWLWQGPWLVALFIFSDSLDGNMARKIGRHSQWGSFLRPGKQPAVDLDVPRSAGLRDGHLLCTCQG